MYPQSKYIFYILELLQCR